VFLVWVKNLPTWGRGYIHLYPFLSTHGNQSLWVFCEVPLSHFTTIMQFLVNWFSNMVIFVPWIWHCETLFHIYLVIFKPSTSVFNEKYTKFISIIRNLFGICVTQFWTHLQCSILNSTKVVNQTLMHFLHVYNHKHPCTYDEKPCFQSLIFITASI